MASKAISAFEKVEWFSATELAELALPSMPAHKRMINRLAQEERWTTRIGADNQPLVRAREGRGGGMEFHVSLLPGPARIEMAKRGICAATNDEPPECASARGWAWYDDQKGKTKAEAERRLAIINELELLESAGSTRTAAMAETCNRHDLGKSTLWNWLGLIDGIANSDCLPALAPRRKGGGAKSEIDPFIWSFFKSDYLRDVCPTLESCYRRVEAKANEMGLTIPSSRAFQRKLKREVDCQVITLARKGPEALRRSIPASRRTVSHLHAMEHVNIDGHQFDVFVHDDDPKKRFRPLMIAIQDIRSSKILAWRIGISESAVLTRLAFADLFRNFGIPKACTSDNGRAFASKWITGGAKTRFRFKIREEDPTGLLVGLGIEVYFALPYRGQSKPIERSFRDMCDDIAKAPAMQGAYTGNSTVNKPPSYGSRSVPFAEFEVHVAKGIAAHNARLGRRGRDYNGRSFDAVFAKSYAASPVGKATPEQLRMALLAADQKMVNKLTGEIELYGNRYWGPECSELRGTRVTIRFDPEYLHDPLHIYAQDGSFIASLPLLKDGRFDNVADAKRAGKMEAEHRRLIREALKAEQLLSAAELASLEADIADYEPPEPAVIQMVQHRGNVAAVRQVRSAPEPQVPAQDEIVKALEKINQLRIVE